MFLIEKLYEFKKWVLEKYKMYLTIEGKYTCILPDKMYLKKVYKARTGKKLNLKNPTTFTEKSNWLKLYDRNPLYTIMADKYKAREYIAEKVGEEYLVPLLGVWDSPDEIDFDALPDQFVLKCNHDNGVIICKDKSQLDIEAVKQNLSNRLKRDYYKKLREWPYKNIPRKIICEKFMTPCENASEVDYKLMCFNGKVKLIALYKDRFLGSLKEDYYTNDWKYIKILDNPGVGDTYKKPEFLEEIIGIAEVLSENKPFLRVDFNQWKDMLAVGELTFFHHGSTLLFFDDWELKMGSWLELPKKRRR
jgi:hypothetical protein